MTGQRVGGRRDVVVYNITGWGGGGVVRVEKGWQKSASRLYERGAGNSAAPWTTGRVEVGRKKFKKEKLHRRFSRGVTLPTHNINDVYGVKRDTGEVVYTHTRARALNANLSRVTAHKLNNKSTECSFFLHAPPSPTTI